MDKTELPKAGTGAAFATTVPLHLLRPCFLNDEQNGPPILLHSEQTGCGSMEKRCEE